jgi:Domain of unknown function (DUF1996)
VGSPRLRREAPGVQQERAPFRERGRARRLGVLAVSLALFVVVSGTVLATSAVSARPDAKKAASAGAFPGGRYFNVACGISHRNNDDPIVFPGASGRSHNHTYIGNREVDASTTTAKLLDGPTTCDLEADASTYWVPTLYEALDPVHPLAVIIYYTRHTAGPVVALPVGLKMVAGNASAKRAQRKEIASWSCGGGAGKRFVVVPVCSEDSALAFNIRFPNCWNGRTTDSPNHQRHMAYSAAGACPKSHPVAVPTITLVFLYQPTSRHARLSSGKFGLHGDFMNGWDQDVLTRLATSLN